MDNKKIFKGLEFLWLATALFSVVITVYFIVQKDTDSGLYFFFVFLISAAMFLVRRYQRKKQEERENFNHPKK